MQRDLLSEEELLKILDESTKMTSMPPEEEQAESTSLLKTLGRLTNEHQIAIVLETLVHRLIMRTDSLEKQLARVQQTNQQLERKMQKLESQLYRVERLDLLQQQLEQVAASYQDNLLAEQRGAKERIQDADRSSSSHAPNRRNHDESNSADNGRYYDHDTAFFEAVDRLFASSGNAGAPDKTGSSLSAYQEAAASEAKSRVETRNAESESEANEASRADKPRKKGLLDRWL